MLQLSALLSRSPVSRTVAGRNSIFIKFISKQQTLSSFSNNRPLSSLTDNNDSTVENTETNDKSNAKNTEIEDQKRAEKKSRGLTRMRINKAILQIQKEAAIKAAAPVVVNKRLDDPSRIDYSSAYEPAPEIGEYNEFSRLGLVDDVVKGLANQGFDLPTPVQKAVIPRLLNGENLVMAASTGSGKTLAFTLPVIQTLISQEQQVIIYFLICF
jgi:ATP-dependent helicase YprA (DUF1998 family)